MSEWEKTTLGEVTRQVQDPVRVESGEAYPLLGVRWYGEGPFHRETVTSETSKAKRFFKVREGQFIYNRLFAWKGSFGLVGADLDGAYVSNEFPVFECDRERLLPEFLNLQFKNPNLWSYIERVSTGTTASRNRWKEAQFNAFPIALPSLAEQRRIVDVMAAVDAQIEALETEVDAARTASSRMRADRFLALGGPSVAAGDMFDMLLGRQKSARQSIGDHVLPYLRAANIGPGELSLRDVQAMNFEPHEQKKYGLRADDILLVEGGSLGQAARWRGEIEGVVGFDKHVIRLRPRPGRSTSEYALQWCHWARESGAFEAQATGITIKALGFGRASSMPVPDLTPEQQERLTAPLEAMESALAAAKAELGNLRTFRSTLLTALLNQEIEIPESYGTLLEVAS